MATFHLTSQELNQALLNYLKSTGRLGTEGLTGYLNVSTVVERPWAGFLKRGESEATVTVVPTPIEMIKAAGK